MLYLVSGTSRSGKTVVARKILADKQIPYLSKVALVKAHSSGENDWLNNKSDEYIRDHIGNMIAYSKTIEKGCEQHGLPYFDTSGDFPGAIEAATRSLIGDLN